MKRAIELAEKGRYKTAPNPCVGAVLVYKNTIIAEGYHKEYGKAHAEVACFCDALEKGIFYAQTIFRTGQYCRMQFICDIRAL